MKELNKNGTSKIKDIIMGVLCIVLCCNMLFGWNNKGNANSYPVFYNRNGQMTAAQVKIWYDTVPLTTGNGQSVDISSAGFSNIISYNVVALNNTGSLAAVPFCSVKSISTSAIVVNTMQENSGTVNILGSLVLLGTPFQYPSSTTGMQLAVQIFGY